MSSTSIGYKPSIFRFSKYFKYLLYQIEYLRRGDFKSLVDSFLYVLLHKLPTRERVNKTSMGKFYIRPNTNDFQFINWTFERELKKHISKSFPDLGLFIDIGACIGEYDVWIARKGVPCIAFEPVNCEAIAHNVELNEVSDLVTLHSIALGAQSGTVIFDVLDDVTGYSRRSTNKEGKVVEVKRLDEVILLSIVPETKLTLIKLDVEGMELEVLKGAENLIRNTAHLHIIYEYCIVKDQSVRALLDQLGTFIYKDLDGVNSLAIKVK